MLSILHSDWMLRALIGTLIVGTVCAYLGVYVVLRRIVFVGAALAQISSTGVGLALLTKTNPYIMSVVTTLAGVGAFSVKARDKRTTQESFIGIGYVLAAALTVLFIYRSASESAKVAEVIEGNILTITSADVWQMAVAAFLAVLLHTLFHKQFLFSAFDPETAQASGINSGRWDMFFFLILGVIIALSIKLAGTLLVFGFLVLPAVTALLLSRHLGKIYAVAIASATIATVFGLYASVTFDLPPGPIIVVLSTVILGLAWVVSKFR
jgi:ABC-type Mn2+/Zn2+ transport system permease subunit